MKVVHILNTNQFLGFHAFLLILILVDILFFYFLENWKFYQSNNQKQIFTYILKSL